MTDEQQYMNAGPSPKILRRMGLSDDQEGIMRRYINEEGSWNGHLQNTKKFIERCVAENKPKRIAVLGSGWLLDVPIDFLIENVEQVFLYDIRHPRQIVNRYKKHKNVRFETRDITEGCIEYVYHAIKGKTTEDDILSLEVPRFALSTNPDFVVSVNVLNQLDILIVENLRKVKGLHKDTIPIFRKKIQTAHIESLLTYNSALITDFKENLYDRTDTFIESHDLLYAELPKSKYEEEWVWSFDTQMTYYPNRKTYFNVVAKKI